MSPIFEELLYTQTSPGNLNETRPLAETTGDSYDMN